MSGLKNHICEAADFGAVRACGRCSLVWPAAARGDDVPSCKDAPDPRISLPAIGMFMTARARTLEQSQQAWCKTGDQAGPYMPILNEIAALRAGDRLLALIYEDPELFELLKKKSGGAR